MRVYLVAGELSGDNLGAGLIQALKRRYGEIECRGIGGPRMQAEGLVSLYPLETLSVMGFVEVLKHLPRLVKVRRHLKQDAIAWRPDIMIGIDSPDFTIGLERQLHDAGIRTAHYVSPSVWAWRQGRVKTIAKAVDAMLTFLPFEADFYLEHRVPVAYVGHPLADELPLTNDRPGARAALGLEPDLPTLALLPGSRGNEIRFQGERFLRAAAALRARLGTLQVVIPAASAERKLEIETLLQRFPELAADTRIVEGRAREAMVASDAVLLTSGTAALETMLCHRAMVVAYRMAPATWWLAQRLVKTRWIALPNLIAQETLVPELIQDAASEANIVAELAPWFEDVDRREALESRFAEMHAGLQRGASERAAKAVTAVVERGSLPSDTAEI
ncbi:lipid-A-disaccharide synthase [Salinicola rhizosphaerae]|uniref:Lipid-A-disaccharide synthase n=1 Tax=Salinicola rhizosphaerae TaxID=1443141 RepID=A0ABQ3DY44_9GAMM|nr:lipid-A-disaccharide synthase [Salinicola rhizosphaerae]GHB20177.1 lipid-A-disaccharide synthase [Salinicola rhizosphaerae]